MNKDKLARGFKFMAGALPLIFIAPGLLMEGFSKSDQGANGLLILSLSLCFIAIILFVFGLRNLLSGFFDSEQ